MSSVYQDTTKGLYKYPQIEHFVSVKDYLFLRENGNKYLLIRYMNDADFIVNSMELTITQLDSSGSVLDGTTISYRNLLFKPGQTYTAKLGIAVDNRCTDFKIQFSRLISGDYSYLVQGRQITVLYNQAQPSPVPPAPEKKPFQELSIHPIQQKKKGLAILCGILVLILLMGLSALQLWNQSQDSESMPPYEEITTGIDSSALPFHKQGYL